MIEKEKAMIVCPSKKLGLVALGVLNQEVVIPDSQFLRFSRVPFHKANLSSRGIYWG